MTRILIAAGGTGGHIFPALAIADELRRHQVEVAWLGSGGMETTIVPKQNIALHTVHFSSPRGIGGLLKLINAVWQARRLIKRLQPVVVLGMGGYASAPAGLAAATAGIPLLIHEQNAVAGRANQLLRRFARRILTGFPDSLPNGEWVGNPARPIFFNEFVKENIEMQNQPPCRLLILGGSQGARVFNTQVPAALSMLENHYKVVHQCGRGNLAQTQTAYQQANRAADICEFIEDVADNMAAADLVICRAGAATLSELAAAGAAALLVPYPFAAANHQSHNAQFFAKHEAAFKCEEKHLSAAWLAKFLSELTPATVAKAALKVRALARPEAAAEIANACLKEAKHAS